MEYSLPKIQKMLQQQHFDIKKKFGQNFIIDENIINNIINKAKIDHDTLVIEIGPGIGSLTNKLALVAQKVLCYEIDTTLKPFLDEVVNAYNNVEIHYEDFLKANINQDINQEQYQKIYVVANLPYYITTPILVKLIESNIPITKIIIMVQKEVGDRFKAQPGTKDYSSLSVFLSYYYDIKKIMDVSRNVFLPKPNVDSIVLEFNRKEVIVHLNNKELFFQLVRDSFKYKRKNIRNNLANYDLKRIEEILKKYHFDLSVRAEQLSLDIFIDLANNL